ncbi:MAG: glucose-6-phosphate dehydrogenase [Nitrosarchaeum sp.]|nr:glucose-6-phosphate dehydrogenase [Nitrosarchaeum sp.]
MRDATFIVFGATGDLAKRKIIPALYELVADKQIDQFRLVLVGRRQVAVEEVLRESALGLSDVNPDAWLRLAQRATYHQVDIADRHAFEDLRREIERLELGSGIHDRVFYLAMPPSAFEQVTANLHWSGLARNQDRLVYEKPFGSDLASARKLNACIAKAFPERQVYRIDHYLGKELVANIAMLRFTNRILEPLWCREHIAQVDLVLSERLGMEGRRGEFYDANGALRDVVQNHLLQLLALVAMEQPKTLTGDDVREQKAKVLSKTVFVDGVRGQYEGYTQELGVAKDSTTETFAALRLEVRNARWKGVPFFVKTGKMLARKEAAVIVKFKRTPCLLAACPEKPNELVIRIQPEPRVSLVLNAKTPGREGMVQPVELVFDHEYVFGSNTPDAYEALIVDALRGEQGLFVRADEVELAWKVVDAARAKLSDPPGIYARGSEGPAGLLAFEKRHQVRWDP